MSQKLSMTGCAGEDVIAFPAGMYRADQISAAFQEQAGNISQHMYEMLKRKNIDIYPDVYQDGLSCEVLSANSSGWRKGKAIVKFELEFIPDEIEEDQEGEASASVDSSLDSLRAVTH